MAYIGRLLLCMGSACSLRFRVHSSTTCLGLIAEMRVHYWIRCDCSRERADISGGVGMLDSAPFNTSFVV